MKVPKLKVPQEGEDKSVVMEQEWQDGSIPWSQNILPLDWN